MKKKTNLPEAKIDSVVISLPEDAWGETGREWVVLDENALKLLKITGVHTVTGLPDTVEAWHSLKNGMLFICCLRGMMKLALFDHRRDSETFGELQEIFLGESRPLVVQVPAGVFYGWKSLPETSVTVLLLIAGASPEFDHLPADSDRIPYQW